jgi:type VI secretion system Hcp family effector
MKIFLNIPEAKGDATATGYTGQIECQSFTHQVETDRDGTTGQTTGRRRYESILITKAWDKSSPALGQAIVAKTVYPKATFTFVAETPTFGAKHLLVELTNVTVRSVAQSGAEGGSLLPVDKVSFDFIGIDVTYSPPGVPSKRISDSTTAP